MMVRVLETRRGPQGIVQSHKGVLGAASRPHLNHPQQLRQERVLKRLHNLTAQRNSMDITQTHTHTHTHIHAHIQLMSVPALSVCEECHVIAEWIAVH